MKNNVTYKRTPNSGGSSLSTRQIQDAIKQGAERAMKKAFPNGDPSFFIPTYSLNKAGQDDIKNPYANNVWVYSACTAITTNLLQLPKVLDDVSDNDEEVMLTEHPLLSLLENPNPLMDGPTFWENVILDLLLPTPATKGGQCFILAESGTNRPVNLQKGEIPLELYPFSDDFITPIQDKADHGLLGWKYKVPNGNKEIIYKPEELIRIFLVDPRDMLKGQSPVWAARRGIRTDQKAVALNENFFDNNASLGGALQTDAELDAEIATEIRSKFEESYAGQENAGRIPLLHSGVSYKQYSQSHQEMQFLDQRKYTREEILAVYRVPKFMVSVYEDINFATAKAADRGFWTNTLLPLDDRVVRSFNNQWIKYIEEGQLRLKSDFSRVQALQPDLTEKLEQAKQMFDLMIPVAEINRRLELQLDIEDYDWLQTHLVNFNLVPAADTLDSGVDEEEEEPVDEEIEVEEDSVDAIIARITDTVGKKNEDEKLRDAYTNNVLIPEEKKFKNVIDAYLREQRNMVLDNVDAWSSSDGKAIEKAATPNPDDFMFDKKKENKRLQKRVRPNYQLMAEVESSVIQAELGAEIVWSLNSPSMQKVLKERLKTITSINTTTTKIATRNIQKAIDESLQQGQGIKQTARNIKKAVNKSYTNRFNSNTIARTEVGSVHSQTRMDIYKSVGIKKIRWITAADELVRTGDYDHVNFHEVTSTITKGFRNIEKIRFPHDPGASAGNVINCRCIVRSVKENKE